MDLKLKEYEKKLFLSRARAAIAHHLKIPYDIPGSDTQKTSIDHEKLGAFVTIHMNGELRGCIGYIKGFESLEIEIENLAIQSAFHDPRFHPLTAGEFSKINLEITLLSPFERIDKPDDFEIGIHGLYLTYHGFSGVFLPQVATEQGWNKEEFLKHLTYKAGLDPSILNKKDYNLYKFSGVIFSES